MEIVTYPSVVTFISTTLDIEPTTIKPAATITLVGPMRHCPFREERRIASHQLPTTNPVPTAAATINLAHPMCYHPMETAEPGLSTMNLALVAAITTTAMVAFISPI